MSLSPASPSVSVAMCTYNGAAYVADQIMSIANQTRPPIELVIGDDGSNDDTVAIVRRCAAATPFPIRLEVNSTRKGFVENFLDTMSRCEATVIALADQDDVWAGHKLATATKAFDDPRTMSCVHEVEWVDDALRPLAPPRRFRTGFVRRASVASPWFVPEGSRFLFRRRVLDLMPREPRPLALDTEAVDHPAVHDEWVGFAARSLGNVAYLPVTLGVWRRHDLAYGFGRGAERPASRIKPLAPLPLDQQLHQLRVVQSRIDYLERVTAEATEMTANERASVAAEVRRYRALAPRMQRRQAVYRADSGARHASAVAANLVRGSYASQQRGGHGWLGLVQDLSARFADQ